MAQLMQTIIFFSAEGSIFVFKVVIYSMKKMLTAAIVIATLLMINSCKKSKPTYSDTQVRILNTTSWVFYDFTVDPQGTLSNTPGPLAYNYGQINTGSASDYHKFDRVYKYAWVNLTMNGKVYWIRPFDYIGETELAFGRFTYKMLYDASSDRVSIALVQD
ncbi:MAG: hypothetical protein WBP16_09875 [Ferruginibacter sp.]